MPRASTEMISRHSPSSGTISAPVGNTELGVSLSLVDSTCSVPTELTLRTMSLVDERVEVKFGDAYVRSCYGDEVFLTPCTKGGRPKRPVEQQVRNKMSACTTTQRMTQSCSETCVAQTGDT